MMMTKWKTYRLGDITIMRNGKKRSNTQGTYPVYGGNGIMDYADCYNAENTIIVGRVGAYCGNVYQCKNKCWVSDNAISVSANELVDDNYLYYLMSSLDFHHHHIGGAQPLITQDIIGGFEIYLPPLEEQRRIAGILGAIDDKIENNRRINTNLELQAQALYKQWFVDNRSDDWERKPLSEIAEFIGGYSYKGNELVESSSTAMATIKNFERKGGFKVEGFKDIVASPKLKAEQHAKLFDILVAHTDLTQNADVIGNAEILLTFGKYSDIIFSMDLVKVLPKCNFPYKYLLAALLKNPYFKAHCLGYVNGTTVLHMSKKALSEYVVACPSNLEAEKMDGAFKAYYQKMAEILQENETLATLRDTLLPKLMNGEIKL
jgi:type I restriction enzyme S subunit